ncbi:MAG: hypothetical protein RID91_12390 [Azospirillaceae bacterium]
MRTPSARAATPSSPAARPTGAAGLVLVVAAAALAACAQQAPPPPATAAAPDPRADYVPGGSAIICYRTLGAPDCYAAAQPGPPNRFIGAYGDRTGASHAGQPPRVAPPPRDPNAPVPLVPASGS